MSSSSSSSSSSSEHSKSVPKGITVNIALESDNDKVTKDKTKKRMKSKNSFNGRMVDTKDKESLKRFINANLNKYI